MIRIAHVITGLPKGGAQTMLWRLLFRMDPSRFQSVVISLRGEGPLGASIRELSVPVYSLGIQGGLSAARGEIRMVRLLREHNPHIIHGWLYHGNLAATLAALCLGGRTPVVWSIRHSLDALEREKRATRAMIRLGAWFSRSPAIVLYNSVRSADQHRVFGYRARQEVVIPNGFDCDVFRPSPEARSWLRREVLGVPEETLLIGMVARYHPVKDHATFLRAAGRLSRDASDVHFVLVGDGIDRSNASLIADVSQNGLDGKAHMLGARSDVPRLMAGLDIVASSSRSEAFPNVIGEAMACGVPCVVTDVGDSALLVGDRGIVIPPRDANALYHAWVALIVRGREERARLGDGARQRILTLFFLGSAVTSYKALYEGIVRGACST